MADQGDAMDAAAAALEQDMAALLATDSYRADSSPVVDNWGPVIDLLDLPPEHADVAIAELGSRVCIAGSVVKRGTQSLLKRNNTRWLVVTDSHVLLLDAKGAKSLPGMAAWEDEHPMAAVPPGTNKLVFKHSIALAQCVVTDLAYTVGTSAAPADDLLALHIRAASREFLLEFSQPEDKAALWHALVAAIRAVAPPELHATPGGWYMQLKGTWGSAAANGSEDVAQGLAALYAARDGESVFGSANVLDSGLTPEQLGVLCDMHSPREQDPRGISPLHLAARMGEVTIMQILLASGANAQCADEDGASALLWAARHLQVGAAIVLVTNGADVNAGNVYGDVPLAAALRAATTRKHAEPSAGLRGFIDALMLRGAAIPGFGSGGLNLQAPALADVLHAAAPYASTVSSIPVLVRAGVNANARATAAELTPLHVACGADLAAAQEAAAAAAAAVAAGDGSAASDAALNDARVPIWKRVCRATATELLAMGAAPNARDAMGRTPMHFAAQALVEAVAELAAPRTPALPSSPPSASPPMSTASSKPPTPDLPTTPTPPSKPAAEAKDNVLGLLQELARRGGRWTIKDNSDTTAEDIIMRGYGSGDAVIQGLLTCASVWKDAAAPACAKDLHMPDVPGYWGPEMTLGSPSARSTSGSPGSPVPRTVRLPTNEYAPGKAWGDGDPPNCLYCGLKFGLLKHRHHCRSCHTAVCGDCGSKNFPMRPQGSGRSSATSASRVCDGCFTRLCSDASAARATAAERAAQAAKVQAGAEAQIAAARGELLSGGGSAAAAGSSPDGAAQTSAAATLAALGEAKQKLNERGEKLATLEEKTSMLMQNADAFAEMAAKLAEQERRKAGRWGF